ncbi:PREDICTED: xylose isomerase 2-like [Priapulus caudatus]|uniref:Xylose isomerase 2-like n=1 Tax=Priapulus caudatus TaxID=37621 RepID=A0ABM1E985_PRICU|nr:PREDICTED: xylose isomerase 2-like [Priapulus caudatus]
MSTVLEQGGLAPGGLNFDCKVRRESSELADMFVAHVCGMDAYARGLLAAARITEDGLLDALRQERYASYKTGIGARISDGAATLEECENYIIKQGEPQQRSGRQEHYEAILNRYV